MSPKKKIFGAAILGALLLISTPLFADATATVDLTSQLQNGALAIEGLRAVQVGDIVLLRGKTLDPGEAARAALLVQQLGYARVANLIQVTDPPDDAAIERIAKRHLAMQRALDGCSLRVDSQKGVLTVVGKVASPLQKDVAIGVLRNIDGVRSVKANFEN